MSIPTVDYCRASSLPSLVTLLSCASLLSSDTGECSFPSTVEPVMTLQTPSTARAHDIGPTSRSARRAISRANTGLIRGFAQGSSFVMHEVTTGGAPFVALRRCCDVQPAACRALASDTRNTSKARRTTNPLSPSIGRCFPAHVNRT